MKFPWNREKQSRTPPPLPPMQTAPDRGLTQEEVALRESLGLCNDLPVTNTRSCWTIVKENTFTFFNLIFVLLGLALILVGSYKNMAFLLVAACNTAIGVLQELRAKRAVDRLTVLSAASFPVIREGSKISLPSYRLVRDDVVEFAQGDQICADALVAVGKVYIDESLLTGESDPVERGVGSVLRSGSFVLSGTCLARLTHVGRESYAAKLTAEAGRNVRATKSDMMESLTKLIRVIGLALIPIGSLLFLHHYGRAYQAMELTAAVELTVSALIGMIPEGLFLLTSIAMASACLLLSQKRVLVQDLNSVENLAYVDVLCVDKTGTITEAELEVDALYPLTEELSLQEIETRLSRFHPPGEKPNGTAEAILRAYPLGKGEAPVHFLPFSSDRKWAGADLGKDGKYILGAPEFILRGSYEALRSRIEGLSAKGHRILLFASCEGELKQGYSPTAVTPLALISLRSILRPHAEETFRYFRQQNVTVKVISGDNPLTVSAIAERVGIEGAEQYVDASLLKTEEELKSAAEQYTVFGRVTPEQKQKLIRAMKEQGHNVAMTGDGVNDVLALKEANCSIAMACGSQAACQISRMVLLNSDFSAIPEILAQGRRVINNIRRSASLFLVKNIFSIGLALILLFVNMVYPLQAIQLSLISSLTIGIPGFFLAMEPNYSRVKGRFLRNVIRNALPGGLTDLLMLLLIGFLSARLSLDQGVTNTLCVYLVAGIGFMTLYHVCVPFSSLRRVLFAGLLAAGIGGFLLFPGFLELSALQLEHRLLLALLLPLGYLLMRGIKRAIDIGT